MVKKINTEEFNNEAVKGLAVVDFSATWCGPCKMLAPILEEISEEMTDVAFYQVDVDDEDRLAIKYGITNIPAVLVMKDGVKQDILVGFKPKDLIKGEIEALIK